MRLGRGPLASALFGIALAWAARAEASASPTGVRVTLSPERAFLLLGAESSLSVAVEVTGPGAEALTPTRTFATVGTLEAPQPTGVPGHFLARYLAPADRFPEVALLVVELAAGPQRLRGVARLALHASTEMALRTSPLAQVTLRVGERSFGPAAADKQGHVKIALEVPPGVRVGMARAVDHNGNAKETEVDLQPAPFPRVLVIAPPLLEVGSFAEVAVLALDATGEPAATGRLSLRAAEGLVHAIGEGGPGEARFLVEAPRRVGVGLLALTGAVAGSPVAHAELAVPLVAGRPRSLTLSPSLRRLVIGGGAQARIVVSAHDQFGNPTSAERSKATIDGEPASVRITPGGLGIVIVPPPQLYDGKDRLSVEVTLDDARGVQDVFLTGGSPATLTLAVREARLVADGRHGTELRARAFDRNGTPTLVAGLSWETRRGRLGGVRSPREGEYIAAYVPDRAHDQHAETVVVTAGPTLRAAASVEVSPPPERVLLAGRFGVYSNLGPIAGPGAFVEALMPVPRRTGRFVAGLTAGYLRGDFQIAGPNKMTSRLEINQAPLLAIVRYRFAAPGLSEVAVGAGAGVSVAGTRFTPDTQRSGATVEASAWSVALQADAEAAFPLHPGRLVVGVRYLWVDLGRTSHSDVVHGNVAGVMADLGYRMSW